MWFVYVLNSVNHDYRYVGYTGNLNRRLSEHNNGENKSTKAYLPFTLEFYLAVNSKEKAKRLEKYFKTGSGKAVLYKRLLMLDKYLKK